MCSFRITILVACVSVGLHCAASVAGEGFVTATFGDTDKARYPNTLQVEEDLVRRVGSLLQTCDAARYGTSDQPGGLDHRTSKEALVELIQSLKATRRFR